MTWRPHIYRTWNARSGKFVYTYTTPKASSWGAAALSDARKLERQAAQFCAALNRTADEASLMKRLIPWSMS